MMPFLDRLGKPDRWRPILWAMISLVAVVGLLRVGFDNSYREAFRSDDENFRNLQRLSEDFGSGDTDFIILVNSSNMMTRSALDVLRELHNQIQESAADYGDDSR